MTASGTHGRPTRELSVVAEQDASNDADLYRCPGCGAMVDDRRLTEVLAHHQHVLHPAPVPQWFEQRRMEATVTARSTRGSSDQRAPSAPSGNGARPNQARLGRYGHG